MGMLELLDCILLPCPSLVRIPMLVVVSDVELPKVITVTCDLQVEKLETSLPLIKTY
jgi:hypothetical protein